MDGKRGWLVVLGCFLTMMITAGASLFVMPIMLDTIIKDTGWSLSGVSAALTVWGVSAAVFSPICGLLIDKYGARRMMIFGIVVSSATAWLTSHAASLWQLYAILLVSAIGNMSCTYVPVSSVVARWFVKRRSVATGIAMLSIFVGASIFLILTNQLLKSYTWREVYQIISVVWLVSAIPTLLWVRYPPRAEEEAYLAQMGPEATTADDLTLPMAVRTRSFWGLSIGDAVTGLVFAVFNFHLPYFLTQDLGNADTAAFAATLLNLATAGGTLLFGVLGDRFPFRPLFVSCYFLPFLAVPLLMIGGSPILAYSFAMLAGIPGGGRNALFPVGLVYCFGETHLGSIYGTSNSAFMLGNAFAPLISAAIYEATGKNAIAVYAVCMGLLIVSTGLVALIQPKPVAAHLIAR